MLLHIPFNRPTPSHAQVPFSDNVGSRFLVVFSSICICEQINTNCKLYWMLNWSDLPAYPLSHWEQDTGSGQRKEKSLLGQKLGTYHWVCYLPLLRAHWEHTHTTRNFTPQIFLGSKITAVPFNPLLPYDDPFLLQLFYHRKDQQD